MLTIVTLGLLTQPRKEGLAIRSLGSLSFRTCSSSVRIVPLALLDKVIQLAISYHPLIQLQIAKQNVMPGFQGFRDTMFERRVNDLLRSSFCIGWQCLWDAVVLLIDEKDGFAVVVVVDRSQMGSKEGVVDCLSHRRKV